MYMHSVVDAHLHCNICMCRYASEKISKLKAEGKLTKRSRYNSWSPLTLLELQGFLAIIFNMGIIRLPELEDYWKTTWVAEVPFFSRVMSRDRFELIFWMLHVSHSVGPVKKIDKIRLFLEKILTKFQEKYTPTREMAVDETMLKFRGRFIGQQYMPKKPIQQGIKCFSLADSSNGYIVNVLPYTGRETLDDASSQYQALPQPARIVMHITMPYLDQGRHVFTDRYYTSIPLRLLLIIALASLERS